MLPPDVPKNAIELQFIRAGGPGGQHVNKVSSAVRLFVEIDALEVTETTKRRLRALAGSRVSKDGRLVILSDRARSQHQNREVAFERLSELIAAAKRPVKSRVATKPSRASKARRLDRKRGHGSLKKLRKKPDPNA